MCTNAEEVETGNVCIRVHVDFIRTCMQKRKAERESMQHKHSTTTDRALKLSSDARMTERIDNVKEVALSCERKIKELRVQL